MQSSEDPSCPAAFQYGARLASSSLTLGRLLLFRYHDGHGDPFWATAGGELKVDEDYRRAAARELREETGFHATIGPLLRERDAVYAITRAEPARWLEQYFLVQCASAAPPDRTGWTDEERSTILNWRWWNLQEMRQEEVPAFRPIWLPDLLQETLDQLSGPRGA